MAKLVYCYHHSDYRKNLYVKPHFHKDYELVYYLKGKGISHYKPDVYRVIANDGMSLYVAEDLNDDCAHLEFQEGSFIVYPPLTTHDESHIGERGSVMVLGFRLDMQDPPLPLFARTDSTLLIKNCLLKIIHENKEKQSNYTLMLDTLSTELAIMLNRLVATQNQSSTDIMEQAIRYIDDYFVSYIDLDALAQSIGYSPDYFRHLFRKTTGCSPKQYIQQKRLSHAMQQLQHTDIPLAAVAKNCGYEDYPQFSAFFKKKVGVSPSDFRDRSAQEPASV